MGKIILLIVACAYPLLVYFGLAYLPPGAFAAMLAGLFLLRLLAARGSERRRLLWPTLAVLAYAVWVVVTQSEFGLRLYPVLVSLILLALFGGSLFFPPSLIERLARLRGMVVSPQGPGYMRRLTMVWCGFFAVNAVLAAYTVWFASIRTWALYNGLWSYILMVALGAGEMVFRRYYKRRVGAS